jgi:hypothetical protein
MHPLKPGSHAFRILAHLARGHSLTVMAATRLFETYSLSSRIAELRKRGWNVVSDRKRLSSGKFIAVYSLK